MTSIREFAPAKINLTLEIAGRRADGLHELASLVAFATAGDEVVLDLGGASGLAARDVETTGPFAGLLSETNILDRALDLLRAHAPHLVLGSVHLAKHLPVAAGLGGGSADAGALLRAVRRANGAGSAGVTWRELALALGADVPVCFEARPRWMTGAGETLAEIAEGLPELQAVLVNPMTDVPADKTVRVFRTLGAGPVPVGYVRPDAPRFSDRAGVVDFMRARGNALTDAAMRVVPETGAVLVELEVLPGIEHAAVSGAGPTCFGIFPDRETAEAARARIAATRPDWWAVAVTLG